MVDQHRCVKENMENKMAKKLSMFKPALATLKPSRIATPPKVAKAVYGTPEFARWRRHVIARAGNQCEAIDCKTPNRGAGGRLYADHIKEISDGGAPYDLSNGQSLCASCHSRKTARARAKRFDLE